MNIIQRKPIKAFRNYCRVIIFLALIPLTYKVSAQQEIKWEEINLVDTVDYIPFGVTSVNNFKYPPRNLFDADLNTCWVAGSGDKDISTLFLKYSESDKTVLNIFPGYGKSKNLYYQNSRPQKIKISIYYAINPDGYVSEIEHHYKAAKFQNEQIVLLADRIGMQSISLTFSYNNLIEFGAVVSKSFDSDFNLPKGNRGFILKMEILDVYKGSKYNDVCISELFFNDRFVSSTPPPEKQVLKVYLNPDENTLLRDDPVNKNVVVHSDTSSILQIIEVSENKRWAVLISMPAEIEGRAQTTYLLVDLLNKKIVNSRLEEITGRYIFGNEIYFEPADKDRVFLMYHARDGEYYQLELR